MNQNNKKSETLRELLLNGMGYRFYPAAVGNGAMEKPVAVTPSDKKIKSLVKHEPR